MWNFIPHFKVWDNYKHIKLKTIACHGILGKTKTTVSKNI